MGHHQVFSLCLVVVNQVFPSDIKWQLAGKYFLVLYITGKDFNSCDHFKRIDQALHLGSL
jgi:hypothetical protein